MPTRSSPPAGIAGNVADLLDLCRVIADAVALLVFHVDYLDKPRAVTELPIAQPGASRSREPER